MKRFFVLILFAGCHSTAPVVSEPLAVSVSRLPVEFRSGNAIAYQPLDLAGLARPQPAQYVLRVGDNVWLEGVSALRPASESKPPEPLTVGADGEIQVGPESIRAEGKTLDQLADEVRRRMNLDDDQIGRPVRALFAGAATAKLTVVRRDLGESGPKEIELPGFQMDLPTALFKSGGLPAWETAEDIMIRRKNGSEIRVPMRRIEGESAKFVAEDAALLEGDLVTVSPRQVEVYYLRGAGLPSSPQTMPIGRSLDAVEAVSMANRSLAFSRVEVQREVTPGRVIRIAVDPARAAADPRERLTIKAGDVLSVR